MKTKIIFFRESASLYKIKSNLSRCFNYFTSQLKSEYVNIQLCIKYKDCEEPVDVCKTFIVNMEIVDERKFYSEYIVNNYIKMVSKDLDEDLKNIRCLIFNYTESNASEYNTFIKNILNNTRDTKTNLLDINSLFH